MSPSRRHFLTKLCMVAALAVTGTLASVHGALAESPPVPQRLSLTGLYAADGQVDARNLPYRPQYPLWTDGAGKNRWIYLPPGTQIDVSAVDTWRYPVGTKLWKEFAFAGHKVETRLIWHVASDQWVFAAYRWNSAQTDAELAPAEGVPDAWEIEPGRQHAIPSTTDCQTCHRGIPAVVLGFNALQLSDDRDPLAPHAQALPKGAATLSTLEASGRFTPSRPEWVHEPPRIRTHDPIERAVLGYLSANCGNCHNKTGPLARLGLFLRHDVAGPPESPEPARATTVDAKGMWLVPGIPAEASEGAMKSKVRSLIDSA